MNLVSKKFCVVIASAACLLAGCAKKPARPDPTDTAPRMGQGIQNNTLPPTDLIAGNVPTDLTPRDPNAPIDDGRTIRNLIQPVYFEFNQSDVRAAERAKLQAAKDYLDKNPGSRVLLEGHCDWRGTAEYNLGLGDRRANAAKRYLQSLGVPADRLESNSKGSLDAKKEGGEEVWSKDRRAEIVIIKANPTPTPL